MGVDRNKSSELKGTVGIRKIVANIFRKPLDKLKSMCYNKYVIKGRKTLKNQKGIDTMATVKKLTKKDHFNTLLTLAEVKSNPVLVEFIEHELELLAKKNSAEKKPTAQQVANAGVAEAILSHMGAEPNRLFTITELIKEVPACADLTNQRVSAIVRTLKEEGKVERIEEKRKAFFRVIQ